MLKDKTRTLAYRDFMYKNPEVFKDKVCRSVFVCVCAFERVRI
jgi:hypothetical protein